MKNQGLDEAVKQAIIPEGRFLVRPMKNYFGSGFSSMSGNAAKILKVGPGLEENLVGKVMIIRTAEDVIIGKKHQLQIVANNGGWLAIEEYSIN